MLVPGGAVLKRVWANLAALNIRFAPIAPVVVCVDEMRPPDEAASVGAVVADLGAGAQPGSEMS